MDTPGKRRKKVRAKRGAGHYPPRLVLVCGPRADELFDELSQTPNPPRTDGSYRNIQLRLSATALHACVPGRMHCTNRV